MSFLSSPIYTDSPLLISASPSVVVTSNVTRPYSQDYRTYEFPTMMSPTLVVDTPYITDKVAVYSDTSAYGAPGYGAPGYGYSSPGYSHTSPVYSYSSPGFGYSSPGFGAPGYGYSDPLMVTSYDNPLMVASPSIVTGISTESDFITPGVIDVDSPYLSTVDMSYSQPLVGVYENISYNYNKATTDPEITNKYVKHFYYKFLDKWLYGDMSSLLNHFSVSGGTVKLASYKSSNSDNFQSKDIEHVADYISKNLLTKTDMMHLLHQLIKRKMGLTWAGLARNERIVQKAIKKYIKNKLENKVK